MGVRKVSTKNWVKKFITFTTNQKYVTGHFQEKLSPHFEFAKFNRIPLAIPVLKTEYENITLSYVKFSLKTFISVNFDPGIPD